MKDLLRPIPALASNMLDLQLRFNNYVLLQYKVQSIVQKDGDKRGKLYLESPTKSLETTSSSVYPRMPFSGPSAAYLNIKRHNSVSTTNTQIKERQKNLKAEMRLSYFIAALISSYEALLSRRQVKSTTETLGVGTRKAIPVSLPLSSGRTFPTA